MPQSRPEPSPARSGLSRADGFGLLYRFASGHAVCVFLFTRKDFGTHAFETAAPVAIGLMVAYAAFAPCPAMMPFGAVWLALLISHRLMTFIKWSRGWETHSRDDGIPWAVELIWPGVTDLIAKAAIEPLMALVAGWLLCHLNEKLGLFVMAASVSLCVKRMIEHGIMQAQYRAMKDQQFEMYARLDRFRR